MECLLGQERRKSTRLGAGHSSGGAQGDGCQVKVSRWDKYLPPPYIPSSDEEEDPEYLCEVCQKDFQSKSKLQRHIVSLHTKGPVDVTCYRSFCSRTFSTKFTMLLHAKDCKLRCRICGWTTIRPEYVEGHKRKHRKEE